MHKIKNILLENLRPVRLISMMLSIAGMIGIALHPSMPVKHDDLVLLMQIFPEYIWVLLFLIHTIGRYADTVKLTDCPKIVAYSVTCLGIWLWSMIFASGMVVEPVESLTLLYVVAIIIELWILVREINERTGSQHHE